MLFYIVEREHLIYIEKITRFALSEYIMN